MPTPAHTPLSPEAGEIATSPEAGEIATSPVAGGGAGGAPSALHIASDRETSVTCI